LEDLGVNGRITLKWITKKLGGGMHWIDLAQDRNRWKALINAVMNLMVPYNAGNFLTDFSGRTLLHGVCLFVCLFVCLLVCLFVC
jgi:hypothetical protein